MAFLIKPASQLTNKHSARASNWNFVLLLVLFWSTLLTSCKVADSGAGVTPTCGQGCLVKTFRSTYTPIPSFSIYSPFISGSSSISTRYNNNCEAEKVEVLDSLGNNASGQYYSFRRTTGAPIDGILLNQSYNGTTQAVEAQTYTWVNNNLIRVESNAGGTNNPVTDYTYDNQNNLTSLKTYANGLTTGTTFQYDFYDYTNGRPGRSRFKRINNQDGLVTDSLLAYYKYDSNMNMIKQGYYRNNDTSKVYNYTIIKPSTNLIPDFRNNPIMSLSFVRGQTTGARDRDTHLPENIKYYTIVTCPGNPSGQAELYFEEVASGITTNTVGCVTSYTMAGIQFSTNCGPRGPYNTSSTLYFGY